MAGLIFLWQQGGEPPAPGSGGAGGSGKGRTKDKAKDESNFDPSQLISQPQTPWHLTPMGLLALALGSGAVR